MSSSSSYNLRGVSADKSEVHNAIKNLDKGIFPNAFCKILPDITGGDPAFCSVMHADTAGTKTALAYLYWKETGDVSVWKGIAQDALVMNLDDMGCVGITDEIIISSTIGRNKHRIPGEVLEALIRGTHELLEQWKKWGIHIHHAGGETADVGDIVRTIDVGITAFARVPRSKIIAVNIQAGDVIVGFASYGQAAYEDAYNGGMGSNGLTSARHDVLQRQYRTKYPETFAPETPIDAIYSGNLALTDIEPETGLPVGKLLLSPTRTYLPLLRKIIETHAAQLNGIIHCTGGAQTKVMKFVKNLHIVKNNLLPTPPLFKLIQQQNPVSAQELYTVFNMGHRLEIYTNPETAHHLINLAAEMQIDAKIIGFCEANSGEKLTISGEFGTFAVEY